MTPSMSHRLGLSANGRDWPALRGEGAQTLGTLRMMHTALWPTEVANATEELTGSRPFDLPLFATTKRLRSALPHQGKKYRSLGLKAWYANPHTSRPPTMCFGKRGILRAVTGGRMASQPRPRPNCGVHDEVRLVPMLAMLPWMQGDG